MDWTQPVESLAAVHRRVHYCVGMFLRAEARLKARRLSRYPARLSQQQIEITRTAGFAVVSIAPNQALETAIAKSYAAANHRISQTAWLVADVGVTTEEVCQKLGVKSGGISGTVVFKIENYYGYASKSIWEWLKVKGSEP